MTLQVAVRIRNWIEAMMEAVLSIIILILVGIVLVDLKITKREIRDLKNNLRVGRVSPQRTEPQQAPQQQSGLPRQPIAQQQQPAPPTGQTPVQPAPPIGQIPVQPAAVPVAAAANVPASATATNANTAQAAAFRNTAAVQANAPSPIQASAARMDAALTPPEPEPKKSWENWIGRNVIGIIASVLVFIGLIFLGILVLPYIGDELKIASMFILSAVFAVGGFVLVKKNHNNFTVAVLGTGCGAFFISILLTHLYFQAINDIPAFILLLVWMAISLFIAKNTQSVLVSILAHIGMVTSICYSFIGGMSDQKIMLLLGYQIAATAVIIVGNILCCKRTYRFGLFSSLAMTIVASCTMWIYFMGIGASFNSSLEPQIIAGAFVLQFLVSTFLSYLLFVSTVRVQSKAVQLAIHIINKLLWLASLVINVSLLGAKLYFVINRPSSIYLGAGDNFLAIVCAVVPTIVVLFINIAFVVLLRKKLEFPKALEVFSVSALTICSAIALALNCVAIDAYHVTAPNLLYFTVIALLLFLVFKLTENKLYLFGSAVFLALDYFALLIYGFSQINHYLNIFVSLGYLVICLGLLLLQYRELDQDLRAHLTDSFKIVCLLALEFGLISVLLTSDFELRNPVLLLSLMVCLLLAHFTRFERAAQNLQLLTITLRVNEFLVIYIGAWAVAYNSNSLASSILYLGFAVLGLLVLALRFRQTVKDEPQKALIEVFSAFGFTLLISAIIQGNTSWFDEPYLLSLTAMLTALVVVLLGFWSRIKVLRLYGLVLMIVCIIKLVTLDIGGIDSVMRVVAFIGGGLICFAISALYNFAVKRLQ